MPMITSGSLKEPRNEQQGACHSQSSYSIRGGCARVGRNGLLQARRAPYSASCVQDAAIIPLGQEAVLVRRHAGPVSRWHVRANRSGHPRYGGPHRFRETGRRAGIAATGKPAAQAKTAAMSNDLPWTPIALWRGQHESIAVSVVAAGGGDACEALDVAL